jgi:hypothetical protein
MGRILDDRVLGRRRELRNFLPEWEKDKSIKFLKSKKEVDYVWDSQLLRCHHETRGAIRKKSKYLEILKECRYETKAINLFRVVTIYKSFSEASIFSSKL